MPSATERQDAVNERWQAMRWRALKRTDLRCERCGAEHTKRILRYLYHPPTEWQPLVIGAPRRPDFYVTTVNVIVVPTALPWTGEESDLEVLCMGCYVYRDAMAARTLQKITHRDLRGQLALLT